MHWEKSNIILTGSDVFSPAPDTYKMWFVYQIPAQHKSQIESAEDNIFGNFFVFLFFNI